MVPQLALTEQCHTGDDRRDVEYGRGNRKGANAFGVVANPDARAFRLPVGFVHAGETKMGFGSAPLMTLALR